MELTQEMGFHDIYTPIDTTSNVHNGTPYSMYFLRRGTQQPTHIFEYGCKHGTSMTSVINLLNKYLKYLLF